MQDLRQWLAKVEEMGELALLRGLSWEQEIAVITELAGRQDGKPALLFDDIPGYPAGFRVLSNIIGSRSRFALTIGFPRGLSLVEMLREWRRRSRSRPGSGLPPRFVDGGPLMENALYGEEVDLLRFPVPMWHERDGGRYMGTADIVITQGPDGGWVNLGTYRMMLHDRRHLAISIGRAHHGDIHMAEWHAQGKAMPIAVALGMDPLLFVVGATEFPLGVNEYDQAGALRGEPVEVMKGPITGLPIPATAEIVLEGFVEPGALGPEGPHGEYMGYYASGARTAPVVRVEALYYRKDPILMGGPPLRPTDYANNFYLELPRAAHMWDLLEGAGVPDVAGVWYHTAHLILAVAVRQRYPGHAKQAGRIACQAARGVLRYTVVVDEEINVGDMDELLWALGTRVDPERDVEILRDGPSSPLDPVVPPDRKAHSVVARVVIDATRPYEWRERFPEVVASSPELRQQVLGRWGDKLRGII